MQEILKTQRVLRRSQNSTLAKKSLLATAKRIQGRQPRPSEQTLPLRQRIPFLTFVLKKTSVLRILVLASGIALSIALLALVFYINNQKIPSLVSADMGGAGSIPWQQAMAGFVGIAQDSTLALEDGSGLRLDISESFHWEIYTVKAGETVSAIAARNGLSIDSIISLNKLTNVKRLYAGQKIKIPNMDGIVHTVLRGENLEKIAKTQGVPMEAILDANDLDTDVLAIGASLFIPGAHMKKDELKMALGELFIYPVIGRLSSTFGWRNDPFTGARSFHNGIDIARPQGTLIKAGMDGRVSAVGTSAVFGNYVIITHSSGFQTLYGHMYTRTVKQGQWVLQGSGIGTVGSTGRSTGPHVHYSIYKNGMAIDPMQFLAR